MSGPRRLLQGKYVPTLAIALVALTPYIVDTSGSELLAPQLRSDIGASTVALKFSAALATAGYAWGALLAGDLVNRLRKHHLFMVLEGLSVLGWALMASAAGPWPFAAGKVLVGFVTGMLLVVALPPTIQQFPAARVPLTAVFINIGLFGGVAAGPLLGGFVASLHAWREVYAGFAVLAALTVGLAYATLKDQPPMHPELPLDWPALGLGLGATALPFGAVGLLSQTGFDSPLFYLPLALGLACFFALLLVEYHRKEPLAPVKRMWSTVPVVGTIVATFGGGVFVTLMRLAMVQLAAPSEPLHAGVLFWPQLAAALVAAVLLGVLFRTRYLPLLVLAGMLLLIVAAGVLLLPGIAGRPAWILAATGLLGLGAGATVSPGLFLSGMSLPSSILGRIVALIELVRSVGDFLIAPVMVGIAGPGATHAHLALWITLAAASGATLLCVGLYLAGGIGLPEPKLRPWLEGDAKAENTAIESPPLLAALRHR